MISIDLLMVQSPGLDRHDIESWIGKDWVRPEAKDGQYLFLEIDVARVGLIRELIEDMQMNEDAMPIVLALLDQLYETRRRMRELGSAIALLAPEELRLRLSAHLAAPIA